MSKEVLKRIVLEGNVKDDGRISKNDTMYCYHTEMLYGIHVSAMEKSKYGKSEKFIIHLK